MDYYLTTLGCTTWKLFYSALKLLYIYIFICTLLPCMEELSELIHPTSYCSQEWWKIQLTLSQWHLR